MTPTLVSASAGSGKTYRLAEALLQALTREVDPVPPEAVLATTFTNKAAAELQERARLHLLGARRTEDAQRLGAARIGTVNAVCGRLVTDFAFELGLPPEQRVLDEALAKVALRRSLSAVRTLKESLEIAELQSRLNQFDFAGAFHEFIALARANAIDTATFPDSAARSKVEILGLLDPPVADGAALDAELAAALDEVERWLAAGHDNTGKAQEFQGSVSKALARLKRGFDVAWDTWAKLAKAEDKLSKRYSAKVAARLGAAAERYLEHPRLHSDLARAIDLVFELARRGADAYAKFKRESGTVDFVDQEAYAYTLLARPDVQERLRDELRLVLVDEFQDTSPLQLAIFTRLAELAPETLWVGDQKQSIFAFRGADAELMDAVVERMLDGAAPEALTTSYRSRPELVRRTSDLFAAAFERDGIPGARVRLRPHLEDEPTGLGPFAERWRLSADNLEEDPLALAMLLRELLADESVQVRDRVTGEARRVRPGDVAVLCRRRKMSRSVAAALAAHGVPAVLPRAGLLRTAEGQLALAGLRLWADPRDRLAAATIARLAELEPDGDAWLQEALAEPGAKRFFSLPRVERLLRARESALDAGPLGALDAVLAELDIAGRCADWGSTPQRLGNLDALRAHAVQFTQTSESEGTGATAAGLVDYLETLAKEESDDQAVLSTGDAVTISTWHAAKGLEWPIVILFQIDKEDQSADLFRVSVDRDGGKLDLTAPLAGRWLRCWPRLFYPRRSKTTVHERLKTHAVALTRQRRDEREQLRLLYVGWTRARDRVILAGREGGLLEGVLKTLRGADERPLLSDQKGADAVWAGATVSTLHRSAKAMTAEPPPPAPGSTLQTAGVHPHPSASFSPSGAEAPGEVVVTDSLGDRLPVRGHWDEQSMGEAFHRFFAADTHGLAPDERVDIARRLVGVWRLQDSFDPASLVAASDRLRAFLDRRYPGAIWHREWPLRQRLAAGTELRGSADLVLETNDAFVVVDHKTFAGGEEAAIARARGYAGQLAAYAGALAAATGKRDGGRLIHLPLAGLIVEVR
jgi:ATP-dependent helicase/nuclease subunit A